MNLTVTQNNLYLFLPSKISWMTDMLVSDSGSGVVDAIRKIYKSATYERLEVEDSKLWHLGPVDLYNDLKDE